MNKFWHDCEIPYWVNLFTFSNQWSTMRVDLPRGKTEISQAFYLIKNLRTLADSLELHLEQIKMG